jgi:hypothetical protein
MGLEGHFALFAGKLPAVSGNYRIRQSVEYLRGVIVGCGTGSLEKRLETILWGSYAVRVYGGFGG